jgi:hypothetical protein
MKRIVSILLLIICVNSAFSQQIQYSQVLKEENEDINFEVLGKFDSTILIYKNVRSRHYISVYSLDMKWIRNMKLSSLPEKTFNVDFMAQPKGICMIYQYNKGGQIFCYGIRLSPAGDELNSPVLLDTSRVAAVADKRIYSVVCSDDRKHFTLYKLHIRDENLNLLTKLYDEGFNLLDSSRHLARFEDDHEMWGDAALSNAGDFYLVRQKRVDSRVGYDRCDVYVKKRNGSEGGFLEFPLEGNMVEDVRIKIDNRNEKVILNALYFTPKNPSVQGLFAAAAMKDGSVLHNFNEFDNDIRVKINSSGKNSEAFDDLFLGNTFVRKNGSYLLTSESMYSRTNADNRRLNRWDNFGFFPFSSIGNPYYYYNPYYYNSGFYRPPYYYNGFRSTRYYADDILVMSIDTGLRLQWNSLVTKKQYDDDNENFISYATLLISGELHFFFIADNRKNESVSDVSVLPDGTLRRNPPLRAGSALYSFMPRLAKQVSAAEMIMPCTYRGNIIFALIRG